MSESYNGRGRGSHRASVRPGTPSSPRSLPPVPRAPRYSEGGYPPPGQGYYPPPGPGYPPPPGYVPGYVPAYGPDEPYPTYGYEPEPPEEKAPFKFERRHFIALGVICLVILIAVIMNSRHHSPSSSAAQSEAPTTAATGQAVAPTATADPLAVQPPVSDDDLQAAGKVAVQYAQTVLTYPTVSTASTVQAAVAPLATGKAAASLPDGLAPVKGVSATATVGSVKATDTSSARIVTLLVSGSQARVGHGTVPFTLSVVLSGGADTWRVQQVTAHVG